MVHARGASAVLLSVTLLGCAQRAAETPAYAEDPASAGSETSAPSPARASEPAASAAPEPSAEPAAKAPVVLTEPGPLPSGPVFVNGQELGVADLRELEAVLGQMPESSRYWYDATSGLWGLQGHGASGVTRPGLRAPALPADASRGDSKVFVNGRELAQGELRALARLLEWPLEAAASYAGRYLLDEHGGLYGPGNRYLGNLLQAASKLGSSAGACCLFRFGERGVLGRAVTIECD